MPRKPRELVAGGVYHVYARGNRRQAIFLDDGDRRLYLAIWGSVAEEMGWRCLAYCLMDNHVHHVVETPQPNLDVGVRNAHGAYGRLFNEMHAKTGHVFAGRFGSTLAPDAGAVLYFVSYVVVNPVRAGLCDRAEDYPWSSHRAVLGKTSRPRWLDIQRLLACYGIDGVPPRDLYVQLVDAVRIMGAPGFEPGTSRLSG
jgi:putative transposase